MARRTHIPEQVENVIRIRLGVDRWTLTEVAREVGLSKEVVIRIATERRMDRPSRRESIARVSSQRETRVRRLNARLAREHVATAPSWIPPDLVEDYADFASDFGVAEAEARVRRLMADSEST